MKLLVDEMPTFPDDDCMFSEPKWNEEEAWVTYCKLTSARCDLDEEQCSCLKAPKNKTEPQTCDTCKHDKLEWYSEICSGCSDVDSHYEPQTKRNERR